MLALRIIPWYYVCIKLVSRDFLTKNMKKNKIYVDLGCGNKPITKKAIGIDLQKNNLKNFIQANYLSSEALDLLSKKLLGKNIDVLNSSYSLCFNKREKLEEFLPRYFSLLSTNGKFIINDFGPNEGVVINRTHIDEMIPFFKKYFNQIKLVKENKVQDEDHFHYIIKFIFSR